jgi:deoxyribonuclease V
MQEKIPSHWLFPSSLEEATEVQKHLARQVVLKDLFDTPNVIGGVDVSNNIRDPAQMIYAAVVALDMVDLKVLDHSFVKKQQLFPYVPGFLGFREAPALVDAFYGLQQKPQLLLVDGHGISHPRGLGIASHLGVLLDIPTIGVAKSILVGKPQGELGPTVGSQTPLLWKGKQIAALLRTKARSNPLIISTGHRVSLPTAIEIVLNCLRGYRLPEPTRQAHLAANLARKQG